MKELTESPANSAFRLRFEAGRSFDLDDDLEFCPSLLTEDDVSIHRNLNPNDHRLAWSSLFDEHCSLRTVDINPFVII